MNTIAASLAQGKKIMFVAEKAAALEVVRLRLKALGLDDFLLSLQATHSSKDSIMSSIRARIEAKHPLHPTELDLRVKELKKTCNELDSFIRILTSNVGNFGRTVDQILGEAVAIAGDIASLPKELSDNDTAAITNVSQDQSEFIMTLLKVLDETWSEATKNAAWWKEIRVENLDPLTVNKILSTAKEATQFYQTREKLSEYNISIEETHDSLVDIKLIAQSLPMHLNADEISVINNLDTPEKIEEIEKFLRNNTDLLDKENALKVYLKNITTPNIINEISAMADIMEKHALINIEEYYLEQRITEKNETLKKCQKVRNLLNMVQNLSINPSNMHVKHLIQVNNILKDISREILALRTSDIIHARSTIEKGHKQAERLLRKQEALRVSITLDSPIIKAELNHHIMTLTNANLLSVFSAQYRKTKAFYNSIHTSKKFNRMHAINHLKELEHWMTELEEFNAGQKLQLALGEKFDGLYTVFDPFLKFFNYFDAIDQYLSECDDLKMLLRSGNAEILLSFPKFDCDHPIHTFKDLDLKSCQDEINAREVECNTLRDAILQIETYSTNFYTRSGWTIDQLRTVVDKVKDFQYSLAQVINNTKVSQLLGTTYGGINTQCEDLTKLLSIAKQINTCSYRSLLISLMQNTQRDNFSKCIESIINDHQELDKALKKLTELTHINFIADGKALKQVMDHLNQAASDKEGLIAHSRLFGATSNLRKNGYGVFLDKISTPGDIITGRKTLEFTKIYQAILVRSWALETYAKYGSELSKFAGEKLSSLRDKRVELDKKIMALSTQKLRAQLYDKAAECITEKLQGVKGARKSQYTEMALLRHEITKTKRHSPMRHIVAKAGKALLELKPCWMMFSASCC